MTGNLDLFDLTGKIAAVTGAGTGLGKAMSLALAGAGADLLLVGHKSPLEETAAAVREKGRRAETLLVDLAEPEAARRVVEKALEAFGGLDILVNNAGIIRRAPAEQYSLEDWNQVIQVNATSVFLLCREAGKVFLERGGGKIVNIASLLSFQGGITVPAYAASKGAVAQLTKALANEWASRGICVNAIAPGYMETENTRALRENPTRNRQILERIPAGRWGKPEDLAGAVVFLASKASDYVNGAVLNVDGGWLAR
ncbi:MAG TPA: 2-dehydro-3-deoxy-D-gluconate 5-dehydrogenase KduD [Planctomycetes bacterium]|nr:2-dehydro-3-deoxy-D-gluconate 5-dehydrogenase KduD [Planctomycetota bacterium]